MARRTVCAIGNGCGHWDAAVFFRAHRARTNSEIHSVAHRNCRPVCSRGMVLCSTSLAAAFTGNHLDSMAASFGGTALCRCCLRAFLANGELELLAI